jgi:hypothetical protein
MHLNAEAGRKALGYPVSAVDCDGYKKENPVGQPGISYTLKQKTKHHYLIILLSKLPAIFFIYRNGNFFCLTIRVLTSCASAFHFCRKPHFSIVFAAC